jgi:glutamate racemase
MEKTTASIIKKIGFYDSGLGGLFVMSHVVKTFPNYDYVFLADEKNLPYGTKTVEALYGYAKACLDFLITKEKCDVVVIACNTLSATVYERLVEEHTVSHSNVLLIDIITPTIDALPQDTHYSVFGTLRTIESHVYQKGIQARFSNSTVSEYATVELATLIEKKQGTHTYLESFKEQVRSDSHTCILACTHYGLIEDVFKEIYPDATFVTQHAIMLDLLKFILHTGGEALGLVSILTTQENPIFTEYAHEWFQGSPPVVVSVEKE